MTLSIKKKELNALLGWVNGTTDAIPITTERLLNILAEDTQVCLLQEQKLRQMIVRKAIQKFNQNPAKNGERIVNQLGRTLLTNPSHAAVNFLENILKTTAMEAHTLTLAPHQLKNIQKQALMRLTDAMASGHLTNGSIPLDSQRLESIGCLLLASSDKIDCESTATKLQQSINRLSPSHQLKQMLLSVTQRRNHLPKIARKAIQTIVFNWWTQEQNMLSTASRTVSHVM